MNLGYSLTQADIDAILCALPLVVSFGADTAHQQIKNEALCISAANKLAHHSKNMTIEEFRVMYAAVDLAVIFLSGECPDEFTNIDAEDRTLLSPHFFTLNKLRDLFRKFADDLTP